MKNVITIDDDQNIICVVTGGIYEMMDDCRVNTYLIEHGMSSYTYIKDSIEDNENQVSMSYIIHECLELLPEIIPPIYYVWGKELNEYEVRELQALVKKGEVRSGIEVRDVVGKVSVIREDGKMTENLDGMDWITKSVMKLFID